MTKRIVHEYEGSKADLPLIMLIADCLKIAEMQIWNLLALSPRYIMCSESIPTLCFLRTNYTYNLYSSLTGSIEWNDTLAPPHAVESQRLSADRLLSDITDITDLHPGKTQVEEKEPNGDPTIPEDRRDNLYLFADGPILDVPFSTQLSAEDRTDNVFKLPPISPLRHTISPPPHPARHSYMRGTSAFAPLVQDTTWEMSVWDSVAQQTRQRSNSKSSVSDRSHQSQRMARSSSVTSRETGTQTPCHHQYGTFSSCSSFSDMFDESSEKQIVKKRIVKKDRGSYKAVPDGKKSSGSYKAVPDGKKSGGSDIADVRVEEKSPRSSGRCSCRACCCLIL